MEGRWSGGGSGDISKLGTIYNEVRWIDQIFAMCLSHKIAIRAQLKYSSTPQISRRAIRDAPGKRKFQGGRHDEMKRQKPEFDWDADTHRKLAIEIFAGKFSTS
jgi:hypothetical protein